MEKICLVKPRAEHQKEAEAFKEEFFAHGETVINGSALFDQMDYEAWLAHVTQAIDHAPADWVPATTLFAVREGDGRIVGVIDIRHHLKQPFLAQFGGHIGYAVRPSERRQGYAAEMLRQALDQAKHIGLTKVMLGCFADNIASIKTIEKCGGQLTAIKPYNDGQLVHIYWITL